MVDREARDKMEALIRDFMEERLTSFKVDDLCFEIKKSTRDPVVVETADTFWLFWDDFQDHKFIADKEDWQLLNRLRLLLQSDAELEFEPGRRTWDWTQAAAVAGLLGFAGMAWRLGWGEHLNIYGIPFGVLSMGIAWIRNRRQQAEEARLENKPETLPFSSYGNLRLIRRQVPGFLRLPYPATLAGRRLRNRWVERIMLLPCGVAWLICSPVPLFFQTLPGRTPSEVRVKPPSTTPAAPRPATSPEAP